jgi:O-antigen/teichoic acid export membrane protein
MGKSISKNYLYNVSYQILALITPLLTTPYISRVLGADGIGKYSYTTSIVSYFIILASLGIADYAQREIAYNQDKPTEQSRVFFETFVLRGIMTIISLVAYYFSVSQNVIDKEIYWIQAINILVLIVDVSWFFQGLEEFGKIVFRNFLVKIFNIVLIFLCIKTPNDLNLYIFLMAIMNVIGGISMCLYLPRYLCAFDKSKFQPFRNFKVILQLFLPQVAIQIYTVLDKTMIGMITGSSFENGYYEQAEKIVKISLTLVTSFGTIMLPKIAFAFAHNDHESLNRYMMRSFRFVWFLSIPLMFGLMGIAGNLVPWFFGPGYEKVVRLIQIFSLLMVAIGMNGLIGTQYFIPTKQQNLATLAVCIGAIINFLLNVVLIPYFLSIGAAIASVIAETIITGIMFVSIRKSFRIKEIFKFSWSYFFAGIIMFSVVKILEEYLTATMFHTFTLIGVGSIVYFVILYVIHDELLLLIIDKIKQKIESMFMA